MKTIGKTMRFSDAYRPQTLIGHNTIDEIITLKDDLKEYNRNINRPELASVYLDRITRNLDLVENQIKGVDQFYHVFRTKLTDAIETEKSLHKRNFGTEAGLMEARNLLDLFFHENRYQKDLKPKVKRIVSFSNLREDLQNLEATDPNIKARIDIIISMITDIVNEEVVEFDSYDDNDNTLDSAIRDSYDSQFIPDPAYSETHNDEEIETKTKIITSSKINPETMVPDVLYIETESGDNTYAKVVFCKELPKDIRDPDTYPETLFILVNNPDEVQDIFVGENNVPNEESAPGFYVDVFDRPLNYHGD